MTYEQALEKLYRQECIKLPIQCQSCEKGRKAQCELYECYMLLRQALEELRCKQ